MAALVINRSGGIKPPGALAQTPGTAMDPREFLWEPGPEPAEVEATPELLMAMLGGAPPVPKDRRKDPPPPVLPPTL